MLDTLGGFQVVATAWSCCYAIMQKKSYQRSTLNRVLTTAHRGAVFTCFMFGVVLTGYTVISLAQYYIFKRPIIKKQQQDYAKALIFKEKREKELGLRD